VLSGVRTCGTATRWRRAAPGRKATRWAWTTRIFRAGDSVYYGFSVYILSTWQHDTTEDIVFQWKPWPDACEVDKPPSAFLTTRPSGTWWLRVNHDSGRCSTPGSVTKTSIDLAEIKPGQWHDFVFHFRWSHGSDGLTEVWHQTHHRRQPHGLPRQRRRRHVIRRGRPVGAPLTPPPPAGLW
jgi:hypothetical protein